MKTPEEYRETLRKMRPNIYKFGKLIEDVTTDPATKRTVEGHAQIFEAALDPEHEKVLTTRSGITGKKVVRYLSVIKNAEDMINNCKMKRLMFNLTGTCTGGRCAGFNGINAMWSTTYDMDQELGTNYHERLRSWLEDAQERDITLSGALTDPKGDRSKSPSMQDDPDLSLRVVEKREDGIVVRGAKVMICGTAPANEVFILPGTGYRESDSDYAISFVIPRDIKNLTIVEARRPSDGRELEAGYDIPVDKGGITQAYYLFEDVFVPNDRVFMCGEYKYAIKAVMNFIAPYRSAIGGCVAGQGDLMIGASVLMARANGLNEKVFKDKITQMIINNETTYGMGIAASALGKLHPSGVWIPDMLLSNVNKVHVATLPYDTKRIAQDIGGGIVETGCLPSYKDIQDPKYGDLLKKYLAANTDGETRARIARLVEWLTIGAGVPGCMHGGGSPDGAKMMINASAGIERDIELARRIGNIEKEIPAPQKKR
ncbi:MAG: 4-hydroxyphenylacetate 3-hydroxylase N-terminal domain-containing protein [Candidatus Thermoplasmatota archaeon]|nr:4-hydroxyphenylacetate 3-hydroxylase N-terminal domain-containing protein [Candidatus Thermoplasmatota archaeon]